MIERLRAWIFWAEVRRAARPSVCAFPWVIVLLVLSGSLAVSSEYSALSKWEESSAPGLALADFVEGMPDRRRAYINDMADRGLISGYERTAELQRVSQLQDICQQASTMLRAKADEAGWDVVARHGIDTLTQSMVSLVGGKVIEGATQTRIGGRFLRWAGVPGASTEWVDDVITTFANALITAEGGPVSRASVPNWDQEWARLDGQIAAILGQDHDALLRARLAATVRGLRLSCQNDPAGYAAYLQKQASYYDEFYRLSNAAMRARDPGIDAARLTSPWESAEDVRAWLNAQTTCALPPSDAPPPPAAAAPTPTTAPTAAPPPPPAEVEKVTLTGRVVKSPGSPNEIVIEVPWGTGLGYGPSGYARFVPNKYGNWSSCAVAECQFTNGWCQRPSTDTVYPSECQITALCAGKSCTQQSQTVQEEYTIDLERKSDGTYEGQLGLYWITAE